MHWLKFVSRLEGGATGEEHDTIQGVGEWSTTDGFSGRLNYGFSGLKDPADQVFQIDMEHQSQTGGNGGQRVVVHGVAQFVRKDGVTLVQFEKFSLECVGKPVG